MPRKPPVVLVIWRHFAFNKRGFRYEYTLENKYIQEIVADGAMLVGLPTALDKFPKLRRLYFSCCEIYDDLLPLCKLRNLTSLTLANCFLSHIPREFSNLQKLEKLDLGSNICIHHVCWSLSKLTAIKILRLSYCGLNMQEKGQEYKSPHLERLGELSSLEYLDLSENIFLKELPIQLKNCTKLKRVVLKETSDECIASAREILLPEQISMEPISIENEASMEF